VTLVVDPDGVEIATILELVDVEGLRVADVGCGEGRLTFELARHGAQVFALDPDEESIAIARGETPRDVRRRVRFEVANAAQSELPKGEFDLAVFSWSL
jgi:2-polyprenyl-3-methyl-5-hydroxy-6-metoxy-1,4-benzoquinol methylase